MTAVSQLQLVCHRLAECSLKMTEIQSFIVPDGRSNKATLA